MGHDPVDPLRRRDGDLRHGRILLRIGKSQAAQESERVTGEYSALRRSLDELLLRVGELRGTSSALLPREIVAFIDNRCAEPFSDFAEARNALVQRFGLEAFANVMTQFASGERFVNRAWSAAADGYIDEVHASLERAQLHLEKANQLMYELEQQHG